MRTSSASGRSGSALLITLLMLSLITIIAVAFLGTMTWELSASKNTYENQKARSFAMLGMGTAVAQIRQALDTWDNPYQNFATTPPTFYWSVSPGIITRWSYTNTSPITNYPLFSSGTTNLVNLNAPISDGSSPIAGGTTPPNISVYWANVLKNPAIAASANNPIIGRYAFWVDDENAKININTADGTMKYQNNSLGLGSPSEVSLLALQQGGTSLSTTLATNIVYLARTTGLNSPKEILRASGTTPDLYTNNVFNLTAYSRSPDLNIFGQPKMALLPILGDNWLFSIPMNYSGAGTNMALNAITLQPPKEIYPTPSQLPAYNVINPINESAPGAYLGFSWLLYPNPPNTTATPKPWPLAFRGMEGIENTDPAVGFNPDKYTANNYPWINGLMLANYLAGTNSAGQPITWPPFPGSSSAGFAGKYTPRQIDSVVAQILNLGVKEISPDYPWAFITPWYTPETAAERGVRANTSPYILFGWLSHQYVTGVGRTPKVDAIKVELKVLGSIGQPNDYPDYTPAQAILNIWQEWWMPASYLGGNPVLPVTGHTIYFGAGANQNKLNAGDMTQLCFTTNMFLNPHPPAPLPKSDFTSSYWGNQLLTNNQGIDFQQNAQYDKTGYNLADPDQASAAPYHDPYSWDTNNDPFYPPGGPGSSPYLYPGIKSSYANTHGTYLGSGLMNGNNDYFSPFVMPPLQDAGQDWAPGEMQCVRGMGEFGPILLDMQPNAGVGANTTLVIGGGIQIRSSLAGGGTDLDPTPLESLRGEIDNGGSTEPELYDGEMWTNTAPTASMPGSPAGATIRDRNIASVIPFSLSVAIPPNSNGSTTNNTGSVVITVADPLVNKFPGDWTISTAPVPGYWAGAVYGYNATGNNAVSDEYASGFHSNLKDPDSYWLPQADCAAGYLGDIASQTIIPRSARFPNIGYLQYLRTGIIPDDETQPYQTQHGTPFRLLSFAPSTDTANQQTTRPLTTTYGPASQSYPDWAMLDLLYIPSILAPYGGPYGYYQTNNIWQGYGTPGVLANNSTGGGSTPGRINPNGAVIYTTNAAIPQPGVSRTTPLQALVHGLMVNQTLNTANYGQANPGLTGGSAVDDSTSESDAKSIPVAIESYIRANGPFRMPGELCNVPQIADLRPAGPSPTPINPTRNDLIRQIVGNLTTQSNTFSVWVVGESIAKSKANNNPANQGIFEAGDQVTASVRYHFVVERYLDRGADGLEGNAANPGPDDVAGAYLSTYNDPSDAANHPFEPRYLYRVVSSEEIQ